jgi:hypothetical protein
MTTPVPSLCRLEYLTRKGWVVGHAAVNLLHPAKYVERLEAHGKVGRCTVLDDRLQPTGQVWVAKVIPDPDNIPESILERLVKTDVGNPNVPRLKAEDEECEHCLGTLCDGDGTCLL